MRAAANVDIGSENDDRPAIFGLGAGAKADQR
jgi:hypothetical protein